MREMLNLSLRLLIIAVIAGLVLGATNLVTEAPIKEYETAKAETARKECLPKADYFEVLSLAEGDDFSAIQAVYKGVIGAGGSGVGASNGVSDGASDGDVAGYVFEMLVGGYKSGIPLTIGISEADQSGLPVITRVIPGANQETPGLGTKALAEERLSRYGDQALSQARVDAVTGATITSTAVSGAISTVQAYYAQVIKTEGGAANVEGD